MKFFIIAAVIIIGGAWYLFRGVDIGIKPPETEVVSIRLTESPAITDIPEESSYPEVERDPFASPLKPSEEIGILEESLVEVEQDIGMALTGILLQRESSSAIVNRKIVRVGDMIEGKKVIIIERDRVVLSNGKKKYVLYLRR